MNSVQCSMPDTGRIDRDVPLETAAIAAAQDEIAALLAAQGVEEVPASRARLVIEELAANLIMHGRFDEEQPVLRIGVEVSEDEVLVTLEDAAAPFDPRATAEPSAPGLDDDMIGGLGLALVRRIATIRDYRRLPSGWNRTEIAVSRKAKAAG